MKSRSLLCCFLILSGFAGGADAAPPQCFDKSPAFKELGDAYFDVGSSLSPNGKKRLKSLLNKISGKWKGETVYLSCRGNQRRHQDIMDEGSVRANLQRTSAGGLSIESVVDYDRGNNNVEINFRSQAEDAIASLKRVDGGVLISEKFRQRSGRSNPLYENTIEIRHKPDKLTLIRTTFINGYLDSAQIFGLSR